MARLFPAFPPPRLRSARLPLVGLAATLLVTACADLTAPSGRSSSGGGRVAATAEPQRPAPTPPGTAARPAAETVRASHILIAYKGALRARSDVTRSKAEAQQLAEALRARLAKGEDFARLAETQSDDPSGKGRGGDLGRFERTSMVKPFADAAFALRPGQVSSVVETSFGFHVIKRTE